MAFGFEARNDYGAMTLNDTLPPLVFSERGQMVVQNTSVVDRPASGSVTFDKPVRQTPPPRIFVQYVSGRHSSMNIYLAMTGSPGNWTGFTIWSGALGGSTLPRHVLNYVVCKLSDEPPTSNFGLALYDASGDRIYSSTDKLVKYRKFTKKWTLVSSNYSFMTIAPTGIVIAAQDFIEASSINRGNVNQRTEAVEYASMYIWRDSERVLQLATQQTSDSAPAEANVTNFCIPICQFPASEY